MRFERDGLAGLEGRHQGSKPRAATPKVQARVIRRAQQKPADGSTHWSCRKLAQELALSKSTVQRILAQAQLKPHRLERYMANNDPDFEPEAAGDEGSRQLQDYAIVQSDNSVPGDPTMPRSSQFAICSLCNEPMELETAKTDEKGNAVHEECYVTKRTAAHEACRHQPDDLNLPSARCQARQVYEILKGNLELVHVERIEVAAAMEVAARAGHFGNLRWHANLST